MSAHDDEFPALVNDCLAKADEPVPLSILKVPFGIDNEVLVKELRQLADAIEAGDAFPQELVRTQRDLIDDFKMYTLSVTFGSPAPQEDTAS